MFEKLDEREKYLRKELGEYEDNEEEYEDNEEEYEDNEDENEK
jgi:hypothetical protein